jgi:ribonuclease P protein component
MGLKGALHSFGKDRRLLKRFEFADLSSCGNKVHSRYFLAVYAPGKQLTNRIGISVSRRVGNSVIRNYIKRCVREYFRQNIERIQGIWDFHIIAKKSAAAAGRSEIEEAIEALFAHFY